MNNIEDNKNFFLLTCNDEMVGMLKEAERQRGPLWKVSTLLPTYGVIHFFPNSIYLVSLSRYRDIRYYTHHTWDVHTSIIIEWYIFISAKFSKLIVSGTEKLFSLNYWRVRVFHERTIVNEIIPVCSRKLFLACFIVSRWYNIITCHISLFRNEMTLKNDKIFF